jgi:hypothetical protein
LAENILARAAHRRDCGKAERMMYMKNTTLIVLAVLVFGLLIGFRPGWCLAGSAP